MSKASRRGQELGQCGPGGCDRAARSAVYRAIPHNNGSHSRRNAPCEVDGVHREHRRQSADTMIVAQMLVLTRTVPSDLPLLPTVRGIAALLGACLASSVEGRVTTLWRAPTPADGQQACGRGADPASRHMQHRLLLRYVCSLAEIPARPSLASANARICEPNLGYSNHH